MVSREALAAVLLIVIIFPFHNIDSFAQESQKGTIGYPSYTGNRDHIFTDSRIDFCSFSYHDDKFNHMAVRAVNDWHENITSITGNFDVWDMKVHIEPKDISVCDAFINYYKTPNETLHQIYGIAGYSNPYTKIANVTIYTDFYQNTLKNLPQEQKNKITFEEFQEIIKNNSHLTFDDDTLYRTTLHEIGHALSLDHPQEAQRMGKLQEAKGIMSYNPNEGRILPEEVRQIVKAYPNGFTERELATYSLDESVKDHTFFVGEKASVIIEIPNNEMDNFVNLDSLYVLPNSRGQSYHDAPIKIIKNPTGSRIINDGDYLNQIKVVPINWVKDKIVIAMHFVPNKMMEDTDIIIVTKNNAGLAKEWKIKNVFNVERALFSEILLEDDDNDWGWNFAMTRTSNS